LIDGIGLIKVRQEGDANDGGDDRDDYDHK
jgi:hypothetical protein